MNEKLMKAGFWLAIFAEVYFIVILVISKVPINLATWTLWLTIGLALVISLVKANKPYALMVAYSLGTTVITAIAFYNFMTGKTSFVWGTAETVVLVAVVIALIVWKLTSHELGVIMTTLALVVAAIPTWIDSYQKPDQVVIIFWSLNFIAFLFTFMGSRKYFLDRFMPLCGTVSNGIIIALSLRQFI